MQFALPFPSLNVAIFRRGSFGCESARCSTRSEPSGTRMPGRPDHLRSLAADPLRLSAGGAEPDVATSDTSCRTVDASAGSPLPRSPPVTRLSSGGQHSTTPGTRMPSPGLGVPPSLDPKCLPSARSSTSRSSEAFRDPFDVRAESSAPFRPRRLHPLRHEVEPPSHATSRSLGSCLSAEPREREEDASSPTSATHARHEHPRTVRSPSAQLTLRRPRGGAMTFRSIELPRRRRTASRRSNLGWRCA